MSGRTTADMNIGGDWQWQKWVGGGGGREKDCHADVTIL
jgi:hypothetical protein